MAILLLPFVDFHFLNKYEFNKDELETNIFLSLTYHGHVTDVDKIKNIIHFYYPLDEYNEDLFIKHIESLTNSLLTYHDNHIMIDTFYNPKKYNDILSPFHNKIIPFIEINKLLSDNLLTAIYNYHHSYNLEYIIKNNLIKPISVVDFQLETILNKGLAETHTHLFGSVPFETQWGWLMEKLYNNTNIFINNIILNIDYDKGIVYHKNIFHINASLGAMILSISIMRLIILEFMNFQIISSNKSFSQFFNEYINIIQLNYDEKKYLIKQYNDYFNCHFPKPVKDMQVYRNIIRKLTRNNPHHFLYSLLKTNISLETTKILQKKYECKSVEELINNKLKDYNLIEYIFLYQAYNLLENRPKDKCFKRVFFQYIRYKNLFHSIINQSNDIKGFFEFQMFFNSQHSLIDSNSIMFSPIFQTYAYDSVNYLEIRIGHVTSTKDALTISDIKNTIKKNLLKFIDAYINYLEINKTKKFTRAGIIMHFNKRDDDINKCWYDFSLYKDKALLSYEEYRDECLSNLAALTSLRSTVPHADKYIIGIDAASNELKTEPWVFAPIFRSVKDRWKNLLEDKLKSSELDYHRSMPLGVTYHVGEVFNSIVSGLRHVDEVIEFYGFQNGERLGHATILGIDTDKYSREEKIITLPVIELLDNWLWIYHLKGTYNMFKDVSITYIEEKIWEMVHIIYERNDHHIPGHMNLHKLYEAYEMQFEINEIDSNFFKKCNYGEKNYPCYYAKDENEWTVRELFYSRHCRCYLLKMNKMIQQEIDNDIQRSIYKEAQQFLINKIANKGIIVEINPLSNIFITHVHSMIEHPIFTLNDTYKNDNAFNHIMTTINTDNPGVFGTTLKNQFGFIEQILLEQGYSKEQVLQWINQIRENGINSTFIKWDNSSKKQTLDELKEMKEFLEKM